MTLEDDFLARSDSKCEWYGAEDALIFYDIPPDSNASADECILACRVCREQIVAVEEVDINHWRCLKDSMWSQVPAVQVMAWRMLKRLSAEGWSQGLLDMLYLDDKTLVWAQAADGGDYRYQAYR